MSYNDDFLRRPADFLKGYAICPMPTRINNPVGTKVSTTTFSFKEASGIEPGGRAKKVLLLNVDTNGFPAYWLAFVPNKSKRAVLGNAARFMFTATMDGCSFGFGTKTVTNEILVGHANAMDIGANAEATEDAQGNKLPILEARKIQADAQYEMLEKHMEPGTLKVLHPFAYADPFHVPSDASKVLKYAATVVGIRENGSWIFYCQRRVVTVDGQYVLSEVDQLN